MKKLFILMNHNILESQINEAKEVLGAGDIVVLSDSAWSRIDPHKKAIADDLLPYKERLKNEAQKGDYLLVQGDFG
ncbi:MAG: hypothetical protein LBQ52_10865, partial [Helicobacteraceae bacterium]|nr:hypothetical protein [Helicobacteraceae bacterium]